MKQLTRIILCFFFCLVVDQVQAQFKTWPVVNLFFKNQFDKNGNHHGRWAFYIDAVGDSEKMLTKGRYKHGYMLGKWKTFSQDKTLRKMEKGSMKDSINIIETTEFYANGKVTKKGMAVLERTSGVPRYFFKDEWIHQKEDGSLDKKVIYEEGWPVKTTYADGKVVVSKVPPKVKAFKPGERTTSGKFRTGTRMVQKGNEVMIIDYHENGDSTVTVRSRKVAQ